MHLLYIGVIITAFTYYVSIFAIGGGNDRLMKLIDYINSKYVESVIASDKLYNFNGYSVFFQKDSKRNLKDIVVNYKEGSLVFGDVNIKTTSSNAQVYANNFNLTYKGDRNEAIVTAGRTSYLKEISISQKVKDAIFSSNKLKQNSIKYLLKNYKGDEDLSLELKKRLLHPLFMLISLIYLYRKFVYMEFSRHRPYLRNSLISIIAILIFVAHGYFLIELV